MIQQDKGMYGVELQVGWGWQEGGGQSWISGIPLTEAVHSLTQVKPYGILIIDMLFIEFLNINGKRANMLRCRSVKMEGSLCILFPQVHPHYYYYLFLFNQQKKYISLFIAATERALFSFHLFILKCLTIDFFPHSFFFKVSVCWCS